MLSENLVEYLCRSWVGWRDIVMNFQLGVKMLKNRNADAAMAKQCVKLCKLWNWHNIVCDMGFMVHNVQNLKIFKKL
jgi:hypothetical protein